MKEEYKKAYDGLVKGKIGVVLNFARSTAPQSAIITAAALMVIVGIVFLGWVKITPDFPWQPDEEMAPEPFPRPIMESMTEDVALSAKVLGVVDPQLFNFSETIVQWNFDRFKHSKKESGELCSSLWSSFDAPEIWYKELVNIASLNFIVKAQVPSDSSENFAQNLILSLGREKRFFRLHIAEKSPHLVGFEYVDSLNGGGLIREEPRSLKEGAIVPNSFIHIEGNTRIKDNNMLVVSFDVKSIRRGHTQPSTSTLTYEFPLNDPTPTTSKAFFGVGTLKGQCLLIDSYRISS